MIINRKTYYSVGIDYVFTSSLKVSHEIVSESREQLYKEKDNFVKDLMDRYKGQLSLIVVNDTVCTMKKTISHTSQVEILDDNYNKFHIPKSFLEKNIID